MRFLVHASRRASTARSVTVSNTAPRRGPTRQLVRSAAQSVRTGFDQGPKPMFQGDQMKKTVAVLAGLMIVSGCGAATAKHESRPATTSTSGVDGLQGKGTVPTTTPLPTDASRKPFMLPQGTSAPVYAESGLDSFTARITVASVVTTTRTVSSVRKHHRNTANTSSPTSASNAPATRPVTSMLSIGMPSIRAGRASAKPSGSRNRPSTRAS